MLVFHHLCSWPSPQNPQQLHTYVLPAQHHLWTEPTSFPKISVKAAVLGTRPSPLVPGNMGHSDRLSWGHVPHPQQQKERSDIDPARRPLWALRVCHSPQDTTFANVFLHSSPSLHLLPLFLIYFPHELLLGSSSRSQPKCSLL